MFQGRGYEEATCLSFMMDVLIVGQKTNATFMITILTLNRLQLCFEFWITLHGIVIMAQLAYKMCVHSFVIMCTQNVTPSLETTRGYAHKIALT